MTVFVITMISCVAFSPSYHWRFVKKVNYKKIRSHKNLVSHGSAVHIPIKVVQCQLRFLSFSSSNKS